MTKKKKKKFWDHIHQETQCEPSIKVCYLSSPHSGLRDFRWQLNSSRMTLIHAERTTPGKRPPELGGTWQEGDGLPGAGWRKQQGLVSWKQAGDHCFVRPQTTGSQTWFELSFEIQTISHTNLDSDFFHHKQSEDLVTWVPFSYEALMDQRAEGLQPLDGVQAQWTQALTGLCLLGNKSVSYLSSTFRLMLALFFREIFLCSCV